MGKGEELGTEVTWDTEPLERVAVLGPGNSQLTVQRGRRLEGQLKQLWADGSMEDFISSNSHSPGMQHPDGFLSFYSQVSLLSCRSPQLPSLSVLPVKWKDCFTWPYGLTPHHTSMLMMDIWDQNQSAP